MLKDKQLELYEAYLVYRQADYAFRKAGFGPPPDQQTGLDKLVTDARIFGEHSGNDLDRSVQAIDADIVEEELIQTSVRYRRLLDNRVRDLLGDKYQEYKAHEHALPIIRFCLEYDLLSQADNERKTRYLRDGPTDSNPLYSNHSFEVVQELAGYGVDYRIICAALLHDSIESEADRLEHQEPKLYEDKNRLRNMIFDSDLIPNLQFFLQSEFEWTSGLKSDYHSILHMVDKLTASYSCADGATCFYGDIERIFSSHGHFTQISGIAEITSFEIEGALMIKLADRKNNTETFGGEIGDFQFPPNWGISLRKRAYNLTKDVGVWPVIGEGIKQYLERCVCRPIGSIGSLKGSERLNQLYKDQYVLNQVQNYFAEFRSGKRTIAGLEQAERQGILESLKCDLATVAIRESGKLRDHIIKYHLSREQADDIRGVLRDHIAKGFLTKVQFPEEPTDDSLSDRYEAIIVRTFNPLVHKSRIEQEKAEFDKDQQLAMATILEMQFLQYLSDCDYYIEGLDKTLCDRPEVVNFHLVSTMGKNPEIPLHLSEYNFL